MPESNSNTMDWYRRNKTLLFFMAMVLLMILMMLWVSERLKEHIDRKMPDLGYHIKGWMEDSNRSNHDTKACS